MSEMQNVTSAPQTERLLRRQRLLAWWLSIGTVLVTACFFCMLSMNAPVLSRVVYGRTVTLAALVAVSIILSMLLSVAVFGWQARRMDAQLDTDART
jgi:uncharacterized membrane protein (DUF485 family)